MVRALLLTLLVASCAPPAQRFHGTYEYGLEHDRFREEGRQYRDDWGWCMSQESWELLQAPDTPRGVLHIGKLELTFEAELSPYGRYGHNGQCEREIRITRLIEQRHIGFECAVEPSACERFARGEMN
jgi:hypothetical protein